mmetsp:Transcript_54007/g.95340  ORF Transcript_54007/g.95340 Transcript_54007/m.95340 type:complete len:148 (+) Transcript_54007:175-618(+)
MGGVWLLMVVWGLAKKVSFQKTMMVMCSWNFRFALTVWQGMKSRAYQQGTLIASGSPPAVNFSHGDLHGMVDSASLLQHLICRPKMMAAPTSHFRDRFGLQLHCTPKVQTGRACRGQRKAAQPRMSNQVAGWAWHAKNRAPHAVHQR